MRGEFEMSWGFAGAGMGDLPTDGVELPLRDPFKEGESALCAFDWGCA
jgi:hypothetical protein